ncbi:MAG: YqaJ viral recombinase family protein [Deltaproteobacteria bacterium]|nr:YqaJ viral recombinase family protein [Deltaproteobacteria bacterium]
MLIHDVKQNSEEWFGLKAGKPSASGASRLVTPTGKPSEGLEAYAQELATDLYRGKPKGKNFRNEHTDRGHELEPIAADDYEFVYSTKLRTVGFMTDDDERYGASPDRLIGRSGMLEIKCLDEKAYLAALVYYTENRKAPPDRIAQNQMQLFTGEKKFVYLYYYSQTLPSFRIKVLPIKTYFEMLECQLDDVIKRRDEILIMLRSL